MMPADLLVLRRNPLARRLLRLSMDQAHRRWHAVKVLPWCTKGGGQESQPLHKEDQRSTAAQSWQPIPRFSIVAAMSLNRIIGVDGALPWEHLEQDRKIFTDLTTDQLIILGRATFHEKADLSHIRHVGCCIVVSTTMSADQLDRRRGDDFPDVKCAASLPEALDMARTLCDETTPPSPAAGNHGDQGDQSPMTCWVVGGERLFNEAVMHPSLDAIHLSIVDRTIDEPADRLIRRFPPKYRWDHKFVHVSKETFDCFEHHIYSRNRGYV